MTNLIMELISKIALNETLLSTRGCMFLAYQEEVTENTENLLMEIISDAK